MGLFDKHMVVPAYREEIENKLEYGMETLDKRFCDSGLPMHREKPRQDLYGGGW